MKKTGCKNSRDIVPLKTAKTQDAVFKMKKKWFIVHGKRIYV